MVDSKAKKNVQNRNEKNLYIQEWYIQEKNVYGMEMKKKTINCTLTRQICLENGNEK